MRKILALFFVLIMLTSLTLTSYASVDGQDSSSYLHSDASELLRDPGDEFTDEGLWYIEPVYSAGGYVFRSYWTDEVLYWNGSTMTLTSPMETTNANYSKGVWSLCLVDDYEWMTGVSALVDAWVDVGGTTTIDLIATPSNAPWKSSEDFVWSSLDTSIASVNSKTGVVTGVDDGTAQIRIMHKITGVMTTMYITVGQAIPNGTYFIKNMYSQKYVDLEGPSTSEGAYIQQWTAHEGNQAKWIFDYVDNGYYTIQSVYSSKYVAVSGGSTASGVAIIQTATISDAAKWKILKTYSGNYKLIPKSAESEGRVLSLPSASTSDGLNLRQKVYAKDFVYVDEWTLLRPRDKAIIIVPGIACSLLQNENGDNVWIDLFNISQIACDENGVPENNLYVYNPNNYGAQDNYQALYDTLSSTYGDEYDVIFFAYDWRFSCAVAAEALGELVSYYESSILVAHSMGGLVASSCLDLSSRIREKVDKLITVGTPFTGAPEAIYVIETGRLIWYTEALLHLKAYVKNIPAVYELLPTDRYFERYAYYISADNVVMSNFDSSWNYVKTLSWACKADGSVKPMFDQANSFHNSLMNNGVHVVEGTDVDIYKIVGIGQDTIGTIFHDADGNIDHMTNTEGDGTVPLYSAMNNSAQITGQIYSFSADHVELIKNADCIQKIKDIIDNVASTTSGSINDATISTLSNSLEDINITVVTKRIESLKITNDDGFELYVEGEKVYYTDLTGVKHCVGTAWDLGNNSCQYILDNGHYIITDVKCLNENSTIRIDYAAKGLSDGMVCYENIGEKDTIRISAKSDTGALTQEYVAIQRTTAE